MRTETPSTRWIRRWIAAHEVAGGWSGPATIRALLPFAEQLYRAGATPSATGLATARDFALNSQISALSS